MNKDHVGERCHAPIDFSVSAAEIARWLAAAGVEPPSPSKDDGAVPPMLLAASCLRGTSTALLHEALQANFMRLSLHELDLRFNDGVMPGDALQLSTTLVDVSARGLHELALLRSEVRSVSGDIIATCDAGVLCLSPRPRSEPAVPPAWLSVNDPEDQELAFDERETVVVEPTRGREFADAIADPNPLYRDGAAAQIAGLPDVIVPALYPVTRLHDALQQRRSGAARVARLAVRLVTPVLPGDELRLGFSPAEGDRLRVAVQNQRGEPVLACGLAELRR